MQKRVKFAIFFIALLFGLSVWAYFATVKITQNLNNKVNTNSSTNSEKIAVEELIITETHEGVKYWEIYAEQGDYNSSQKLVLLKDVIGNFYKNNKVVMSFKAPQGVYDSTKREIKLLGGAFVLTDDKTAISAQNLVWMGRIDEIHAAGDVKISKKGKIFASGDKSIFDKDLTYFKVIGHSKAQLLK